ncbi:hypothetical protein CEXT_698571 [Caerostris extrusa]|uniref:Uncharacterized protein n=1 Tax=Caerostris extrusa TaxID=172846 RepID=A0AAV4Q1A1_CAEEX|nr:hypothetical protein CEXT_698571 [Caerostris extrusa]
MLTNHFKLVHVTQRPISLVLDSAPVEALVLPPFTGINCQSGIPDMQVEMHSPCPTACWGSAWTSRWAPSGRRGCRWAPSCPLLYHSTRVTTSSLEGAVMLHGMEMRPPATA